MFSLACQTTKVLGRLPHVPRHLGTFEAKNLLEGHRTDWRCAYNQLCQSSDPYSENRPTIFLPRLELERPKDDQKVVYFPMSRFFFFRFFSIFRGL